MNEQGTWYLLLGTYWRRKNAFDAVADALDNVETHDGFIDGTIQGRVTWQG
jgi:hypothetical protein